MIRSFKAERTEAGLDFDVRFDPARRFHCIVGVNGVGKTHLIEHLARIFLVDHAMFAPRHFATNFGALFTHDAVAAALPSMSVTLPAAIAWNDLDRRSGLSVRESVVSLDALAQHSNRWQPPTARPLDRPLDRALVFVGARERGHLNNLAPDQLRLLGSASDRFITALRKTWRAMTGDSAQVEEPAAWFASRLLVNPQFITGYDSDFQSVVEVLELLQRIEPDAFKNLLVTHPDTRHVTVGLAYSDGVLRFDGRPIHKLATGYVAILKIFQEIIAGYSGWAAMLPAGSVTNLRAMDGIVFIDEIEAHLHPQWQSRIVGILKESFPNTTFFVTTHAPLVVRQTEPGEAIELVRDENKVTSRTLGSPRDWYLADVLSEGFHVQLPLPGRDAPEGEAPLGELLLDFSNAVRHYAASREASQRDQALEIHHKIDLRLSAEDPRRRSLGMLRDLLG